MNFDKCRRSATEDLSTISGGSCVVKAKVDFEEGEAKMMDDSGYAHALIAASPYSPDKFSISKNTSEPLNAVLLVGDGNRGTVYKDGISVSGLRAAGFAFGYTHVRDIS